MGEGKTVDHWDEWTAKMQAKHGNGNGHGKSLSIEAQRLLPTPTTADANASGGSNASNVTLTDATVRTQMGATPNARLLPTPRALDATGVRGVTPNRTAASNYRAGETLSDIGHDARWGDYAAAIQRWEHVTGRPAPEPTQTSTKGNPQLSARFAEWLMGVDDGWITDVPGVTRNEALKMAGNGVVPQQGAAALRWMLAQIEEHA